MEATPEEAIPNKRKSLIIVNREGKYAADVSESETSLTLTTARLTATVDKQSGRLTFVDRATGKVLLREADGSKTFSRYVSPQTELPANYVPSSPDEINWGKTDRLNQISLETVPATVGVPFSKAMPGRRSTDWDSISPKR